MPVKVAATLRLRRPDLVGSGELCLENFRQDMYSFILEEASSALKKVMRISLAAFKELQGTQEGMPLDPPSMA